jgi:uncharacterized protein (DUF433 family)
MLPTPAAVDVPIKEDEHGVIRVSGTRVTLKTIIGRYRAGDHPDLIHEGFPTVPISDVYAVIAYYLANREAVDRYIEATNAEAERVRREIEANYTPEQQARIDRLRQLAAQKRHS